MTDLGDVNWILNMEVTRDRPRRTIWLSQSQYIENILERHGIADCKPATTPMEVNLKLEKLDTAEVDVTKYQQLIGSLMYGSLGTCFDITHEVGILSCHNHAPGKQHHTAVKWVFRYLQGASDHDILFNGKSSVEGPIIYSDADWAGNPIDRKFILDTLLFSLVLPSVGLWRNKVQSLFHLPRLNTLLQLVPPRKQPGFKLFSPRLVIHFKNRFRFTWIINPPSNWFRILLLIIGWSTSTSSIVMLKLEESLKSSIAQRNNKLPIFWPNLCPVKSISNLQSRWDLLLPSLPEWACWNATYVPCV